MDKYYEVILETISAIDADEDTSFKNEYDIIAILRKEIEGINGELSGEALWEFYAFMLVENSQRAQKGGWQTYFGSIGFTTQAGEDVDRIPFEKITCEVIHYWEKRLVEVSNPILKARYAGLVWDLKLKVCGTRPDYHSVALPYIENLILTVSKGKILNYSAIKEKLRRALELSKKLRNEELVSASVNVVLQLQKIIPNLQSPATMRIGYDILLKDKLIEQGTPEYHTVVNYLKECLIKVSQPNDNGYIDINAIECIFEPLLSISISEKNIIETDRLYDVLEQAYAKRIEVCSVGEAMHWLEKLRSYYQLSNSKEKVDEVGVRLEKLGPRFVQEMKVISAENTFSKDIIDNITEEVLKMPEEDIYGFLPIIFIADTKEIVRQKEEREVHIRDLMSTSRYDIHGRKVSTIGSSKDDTYGQFIQELEMQITFSSILLHFIFSTGKERRVLSVSSFRNFISRSKVIASNRYIILETAYEAWLSSSYLVAIHLLIPQIEAACLTIAKNEGVNIHKDNNYGGYNVRLFGDLLRDPVVKKNLGEDGSAYFMTLFSDPRGFNLRNEVAHGLREADGFDEKMANATLIALFHLVNCTSVNTFHKSLQ